MAIIGLRQQKKNMIMEHVLQTYYKTRFCCCVKTLKYDNGHNRSASEKFF